MLSVVSETMHVNVTVMAVNISGKVSCLYQTMTVDVLVVSVRVAVLYKYS